MSEISKDLGTLMAIGERMVKIRLPKSAFTGAPRPSAVGDSGLPDVHNPTMQFLTARVPFSGSRTCQEGRSAS
jgi:hypothetical protein